MGDYTIKADPTRDVDACASLMGPFTVYNESNVDS